MNSDSLRVVVFSFSIAILAGLVFSVDQRIQAHYTTEPKSESPTISSTITLVQLKFRKSELGNAPLFLLTNQSDVPIYFSGTGKHDPQRFVERYENGQWKLDNWGWCGNGYNLQTLLPGDRLVFRIELSSDTRPCRLYMQMIDPVHHDNSFRVYCEMIDLLP